MNESSCVTQQIGFFCFCHTSHELDIGSCLFFQSSELRTGTKDFQWPTQSIKCLNNQVKTFIWNEPTAGYIIVFRVTNRKKVDINRWKNDITFTAIVLLNSLSNGIRVCDKIIDAINAHAIP